MSGCSRLVCNRGFTLLEMVVVLSILGLVTAVAVPSVLRAIETWQRRGELELVLDQIRGLPATARAQARDLQISSKSLARADAPLHVEKASTLTAATAWRVRHNGVCEGGMIELNSAGRQTRVRNVLREVGCFGSRGVEGNSKSSLRNARDAIRSLSTAVSSGVILKSRCWSFFG